MTSDRERPSVEFWITVALVVELVGYPLNFGPVVWLASRGHIPAWFAELPVGPLALPMLLTGS